MDTTAVELKGRPDGARVVGDLVSGAFVVALAGLALYLLTFTLAGGRSGFGAPGEPQPASASQPKVALPSGTHLYIVVVGLERAAELKLALAKESELREALGEPLRDADVISVADEAEAQVIASVITDQVNLAHTGTMAAVAVR